MAEQTFDFLSYTFGRYYSGKTGRAYLCPQPSRKTIRQLCESLHEQTRRSTMQRDPEELVASLNRQLRGWANYFCLGPVHKAYRAVDRYVTSRLRRWLCRKHGLRSQNTTEYSYQYLYHELGLVHLPKLTATPRVRKHDKP